MEAQNVTEWRKVAEFWSKVGVKTMVRNALRAPELKSWLLRIVAVCIDIGYTEGVSTVYQAKLTGQKVKDFPYYENGNMDGKTFMNRQIASLQVGIMNFEFLNYLEANLGMSIQELVDVFKQVYPEVKEKEEEAQVGVTPSEGV